jgi:tetratricopeptide (TPR) repeat protein
VILSLLALVGVARAQEPSSSAPKPPAVEMSMEARAHYEKGLALYGDKDYAGAIRELEIGYASSPRREFLFAEAQALRLSGDCKSAVPLYQKFLASEPEDVQVNATHIALARCAEQMASRAAPAVPVTPTAPAGSTTTVTTTPPPRPAPPAPWYHDLGGGALLGAGVLGLATGTVFTFAALSARDDANHSAQSYPDYRQRWDTARGRSEIAIAAFASGAALTGVAIVRYLRVRGRALAALRTSTAAIDPWAAPADRSGGVAGVGGRF